MLLDRTILMPARLSTIALSFAAALVLDFLPWPDLRLVPEFSALVLAFWCVRQPRLVGIGIGWSIGLISDAGNGLQALHVAIMLLVAEGATVMVRLAAGDQLPGWAVVVGPLVGAALWPMVSWLLLLPQRRMEREQTI